MKRPDPIPTGKGLQASCPDESFAAEYPGLVPLMTDGRWDDGKPRDLTTLSISFADGVVNLGVVDKATRSSAYVQAESIHKALQMASEAAERGTLKFRVWGVSKGK